MKQIKKRLILQIGISGSGKSTWITNNFHPSLVLSVDQMRIDMTGDINNKSEDVFIYAEALQYLFVLLRQNDLIVFDTTNLQVSRRRNLINFIRDKYKDIQIEYKLFPCDIEIAKQRIKQQLTNGEFRSNVPDSSIERQFALYELALVDLKEEDLIKYQE